MSHGSDTPPVAMVAAATWHKGEGTTVALQHPARSPLTGWSPSVAALEPGGQHLVYATWRELREVDNFESLAAQGVSEGDPLGVPQLQLVQAGESHHERQLVAGAVGPVWRSDGALAYVAGREDEYRAGMPYVGDIHVRPSVDEAPETWTEEPDEYVTIAWAGDSLLAYRRPGHSGELVAFDGPGQLRELPSGELTAVSPDGSHILLSGRNDGRADIRVVSVADGRVVADLEQSDPDAPGALAALSNSGDWVGDSIVAPGRTNASPSVLVVLSFDGSQLTMERKLVVPSEQVPVGFREATFHGNERVVATYAIPPEATKEGYVESPSHRFVSCGLPTEECSWGEPDGEGPLFLIENPGRGS